MSDQSFVRTEMLPELEPPASTVGVVGWMRENLFSSWINSILTIISVAFRYYVLAGLIPWMIQSAWNADSLTECREIFIETYGSTHGHACWGVVNDRWLQLLYGFYPSHLYWRVNLALVLTLAALAPRPLFTSDAAPE